jgi:hypothetical protein
MRAIASRLARRGLTATALRPPFRLALAAALSMSMTNVSCSSPTAPSSRPYIEASNSAIHAGDTVTFTLVGFSPERPVSWQFATLTSGTVAFVPMVSLERGETARPGQTHVNSLQIVRVLEATRFTAEAWTVGGLGVAPAPRLIARFSVDALP